MSDGWGRVTLGIDCGACGAKSAIASLDAEVACLHCDTRHVVAKKGLAGALSYLHDAVADDHRPDGSTGDIVFTGERGTPVCDRCGGPVTVEEADERVTVRCAACKTMARHAPPSAWREVYAGVAAVVYDDSRVDLQDAKVTEQDGRATLGCAQCGAAITAPADRSVALCPYCNASSYIPRSAQPRARNGPASRPMWIRFDGRSESQEKHAKLRQEMADSLKSAERDETVAALVIGGSIVFSVVVGLGYLIYWLVT